MNVAADAGPTPMTLESYLALPPDDRAELVRGYLVREPQPGYGHGAIQSRLLQLVRNHLDGIASDLVCLGNTGFILSREERTVRGPDAAVIRRGRVPAPDHAGLVDGAPDLAIEIVSPGNTAADMREKVADYLRAGAGAVWVVYPRSRTVTVHEPGGMRNVERGSLLDGGALMPGFRVPVEDLFAW